MIAAETKRVWQYAYRDRLISMGKIQLGWPPVYVYVTGLGKEPVGFVWGRVTLDMSLGRT